MNVPSIGDFLNYIASGTPERDDVVTWLLDFGAKVHREFPPSGADSGPINVGTTVRVLHWMYAIELFQRAVEGGNRKIVRLLLERGTDPVPISTFTLSILSNTVI
jgi:hypothetical protein